jgi:hypothetical protein
MSHGYRDLAAFIFAFKISQRVTSRGQTEKQIANREMRGSLKYESQRSRA